MTRSLAAKDNEHEAEDWQAVALRNFMKLATEAHAIESFLILVRDSETTDEEEEYRSAPVSPIRQTEFLRHLLPDAPVRYLTLPHVSASSGTQVADAVRDALSADVRRTLVFSASVDRVTRSVEGWFALRQLIQQSGHMAAALLWHCDTIVDPKEAMLLPSAV